MRVDLSHIGDLSVDLGFILHVWFLAALCTLPNGRAVVLLNCARVSPGFTSTHEPPGSEDADVGVRDVHCSW